MDVRLKRLLGLQSAVSLCCSTTVTERNISGKARLCGKVLDEKKARLSSMMTMTMGDEEDNDDFGNVKETGARSDKVRIGAADSRRKMTTRRVVGMELVDEVGAVGF